MWAIKCKWNGEIQIFSTHTSQKEAEKQLKEHRKAKNKLYKNFWIKDYFWVEEYTEPIEEQLLKDLHIHKKCLVCTSVKLRMIKDWSYGIISKSDNSSMDDEDEMLLSTRITKAIDQATQALGLSITEDEKEALRYHIVRGD